MTAPPPSERPDRDSAEEFARQAEGANKGVLREQLDFLKQNKKWWMTPIIVVLILFGVLVILSGTAIAPMLYTLF